jgi:hypothetical protein
MKAIYWLAVAASGALVWAWSKSSAAAPSKPSAPIVPTSGFGTTAASKTVMGITQAEMPIWNAPKQLWSVGMYLYYTRQPDESPTYSILLLDDPNPDSPTPPSASDIQNAAGRNWNFPPGKVIAT